MNQKGFAPIILIVVVLLLIAVIGGVFIFGDKSQRSESGRKVSFLDYQDLIVEPSEIPNNLSLPFKVEDISISSSILNPLGIIRNNRDSGQGHPGIDFPLKVGAQVVAVADGEVLEISKVSERAGDEKLVVLIKSTGEKVGWTFVFEHILIDKSLSLTEIKIQFAVR